MIVRSDIVLSGISKSYEGKPVLKDLDLRFADGKISVVMGPSGLGKTTLLRILLGLETFEGTLSGMEGRKVSAVFQENRLLPWLSLKQNLELVCGPGKERRIEEALALMELTGSENKRSSELSGGMQRRAALARALAYGGDTFILDEPFTGLDEELKARIAGRLEQIWREKHSTVILVTHDSADAAQIADEVLCLQDYQNQTNREGGSL